MGAWTIGQSRRRLARACIADAITDLITEKGLEADIALTLIAKAIGQEEILGGRKPEYVWFRELLATALTAAWSRSCIAAIRPPTPTPIWPTLPRSTGTTHPVRVDSEPAHAAFTPDPARVSDRPMATVLVWAYVAGRGAGKTRAVRGVDHSRPGRIGALKNVT